MSMPQNYFALTFTVMPNMLKTRLVAVFVFMMMSRKKFCHGFIQLFFFSFFPIFCRHLTPALLALLALLVWI
jgi:hypothetical protein